MAISARLARTLHQRLGDEAAEDLVNWMGTVESNRSDLRETMDHYMARTDSLFAEYQVRMDSRFAESQARTDARFAEVIGRMDVGFANLEARFERRFGDLLKWSFVFWCGAVGAIAMLARALR